MRRGILVASAGAANSPVLNAAGVPDSVFESSAAGAGRMDLSLRQAL